MVLSYSLTFAIFFIVAYRLTATVLKLPHHAGLFAPRIAKASGALEPQTA